MKPTGPRINDFIRVRQVLLIDENNERVGEIDTHEALARARDAGLDLVEVSAESSPPVCRIMDFGKFKYEQSKKDRANKAKSKTTEMKEVRLGRSMKIDPHDIGIRLNQARRFLLDGHKVQIVQNFRGREMVHKSRGEERMRDIIETLGDISKIEAPPRFAGRRITMILGPDKPKIEQYKRQQAKEAAAAAGEEHAEAPPEVTEVTEAPEAPAPETPAPETPTTDVEPVASTEKVNG